MKLSIKRVLLGLFLILILVLVASTARNWELIQRTMLGGLKIYETVPPELPAEITRPAILVFSKTNGYRHEEAIPAANALLERLAKENGWGFYQTENGAAFSPAILARFDAVVFNNVSGDVFTPDQRAALKAFIEKGGGFVGVHGSGGDFSYDWRCYVEHLIGAQFIGHPMDPQFQEALVRVEDRDHPASRGVPEEWRRTDEWYSFERSPPAARPPCDRNAGRAELQPERRVGSGPGDGQGSSGRLVALHRPGQGLLFRHGPHRRGLCGARLSGHVARGRPVGVAAGWRGLRCRARCRGGSRPAGGEVT